MSHAPQTKVIVLLVLWYIPTWFNTYDSANNFMKQVLLSNSEWNTGRVNYPDQNK